VTGEIRVAVINQHHGGGATAAAQEISDWGPGYGVNASYFPRGESPETDATLQRELDALDPHLIHLHCWYQSYRYDLIRELTDRWPVVFTAHDPFVVNQYGTECWECYRNGLCLGCPALGPLRRWRPNYRILDRLRKRRVNRRSPCHVICPSQWMERRLGRSEWGRLPTTVIPYSVDGDRICPGPGRRLGVGLPETGPVVLFVGNMYGAKDHRKGLPDLLDAFDAVRALVPDATLAIAGTVEGLSAQGGVIVLGQLDQERLLEAYRAADLLVLPSLGDNLPVTVLEGMAAGLPVVATRVGGIPEQVVHGETGSLVEAGDRVALTEAMASLLTDAPRRARYGAAGRARFDALFTREVSARMHVDLYRRIAGRKS